MKNRKLLSRSLIVTAALVAGSAQASNSKETPTPSPSTSASSSSISNTSSTSRVVHINPDTLRSLVVQGNPSLVVEMNQVVESKDQFRITRNNLLPGANLSAVLSSGSPLSFAINSISVLCPFLLPSNWFNYEASKHNFNADKIGYGILELNAYATIYSLYETLLEDQNLELLLAQEYQNWQQILDMLQKEGSISGGANQQDIDSALTQTKTAETSMWAMEQDIVQESAAMGYALGLTHEQQQGMVFDPMNVTPSQYENFAVADAITKSVEIAPEAQQLKELIAAGKNTVRSDQFAWINGFGISPASGSTPTSATTKMSFSLAAFPQISLDHDLVNGVKILQNQLTAQQTQTLESTITGIQDAVLQLDAATLAEDAANTVYVIEERKFNMGGTNMANLLVDFNAAQLASVNRIEAQANVDALRITLKRAMLDDEFSKLPGCQPLPDKKSPSGLGKIGNGIKDVFSGKHSTQTLDQLCRAGQQPQ